MTEPHVPSGTTAHAMHDPELVAALAARAADLTDAELIAAQAQVEDCADCRDLLADLRAVQFALAASMTPKLGRDFTLSPADAQRLRGSGWRRVLRFFGSSRDALSRPLAIGFTTIGVVALLFTALPAVPLGAGGAATLSTVGNAVPQQAAGTDEMVASPGVSAVAPAASAAAAPAPSAAAAAAPSAAPPSPAASGYSEFDRQSLSAKPEPYGETGGGVFSGSNEASGSAGDLQADRLSGTDALTSARADGPSIGFVIAGISLIIGFGLFALRWTSRRFGDG